MLKKEEVGIDALSMFVINWLQQENCRIGYVTSIDGHQIVTLLLDANNGTASLLTSPVEGSEYPSLTQFLPQVHWYERLLYDLFGLTALDHPRLKPAVLNEAYRGDLAPLRRLDSPVPDWKATRDYSYLHVAGEGIFELPVGPIHAGIIEPAHFRASCLGEVIVNLEIRLGFLHRGVEKRLTEVPWRKARFVAEAAASDTAAANALAHATALEMICAVEAPTRAQQLRTLALETERLAMHVGDVGGMAVDLGFLGIAAAGSRLRGLALGMADMISGSRYLRGFICPGGVTRDPDKYLASIKKTCITLREKLAPLVELFMSNPTVYDRLRGTGVLSPSLAQEFGMVGVGARACGIQYDTRRSFRYATYPQDAPPITTDGGGDALSRVLVRVGEIQTSMAVIEKLLDSMAPGPVLTDMPDVLPSNKVGVGIVEAFRGELIHLVFTDGAGKIMRYGIKDPSVNNWTGVAIGVRNNLIADFPVINKSFSLAYSGHDL